MKCYNLLQLATIAILGIYTSIFGGRFHIKSLLKRPSKRSQEGVGNEMEGGKAFFKLVNSTVTTVTSVKINRNKLATVLNFKVVTLIYKLIYSVTNCYKLLQLNTVKGLNIEIRYSKGL